MQKVKGILTDRRKDLLAYETDIMEIQENVQAMLDELRAASSLLGRVTATQLDSKIFHALVESSVYVRDFSESALNVEKFYLDNRAMLEHLERDVDYIFDLPANTSVASNTGHIELPDVPETIIDFEPIARPWTPVLPPR